MNIFIQAVLQKGTCDTIEREVGVVLDPVDLEGIVSILKEDGLIEEDE